MIFKHPTTLVFESISSFPRLSTWEMGLKLKCLGIDKGGMIFEETFNSFVVSFKPKNKKNVPKTRNPNVHVRDIDKMCNMHNVHNLNTCKGKKEYNVHDVHRL